MKRNHTITLLAALPIVALMLIAAVPGPGGGGGGGGFSGNANQFSGSSIKQGALVTNIVAGSSNTVPGLKVDQYNSASATIIGIYSNTVLKYTLARLTTGELRLTDAQNGVTIWTYDEVTQTTTFASDVGVSGILTAPTILGSVNWYGAAGLLDNGVNIRLGNGSQGSVSIMTDHNTGVLTINNSNSVSGDIILKARDTVVLTLVGANGGLVASNSLTVAGSHTNKGPVYVEGTAGAARSEIALNETNGAAALVLQGPATNSVLVTNVVGLIHLAKASVLILNWNFAHNYTVTNRITGAFSLVNTQSAEGQEGSIDVIGEAAGGTDRAITIVPHLGNLILNGDDNSVAPALSMTVYASNGYVTEISQRIRRLDGTNANIVRVGRSKL